VFATQGTDLLVLVFSYDVMCIYCVHLWKRLRDYFPSSSRHNLGEKGMIFLIPKFHFGAHEAKNHSQYSYNLQRGVGNTHGEVVEENWGDSNEAASQSKRMGPGTREDFLDDIFGYHNFKILDSLDELLPRRLVTAVKELAAQELTFSQFDHGLENQVGRAVLDGWQMEVDAWDADHTKPCPYEPRLELRMTRKDIELQMAEREHQETVQGTRVFSSSLLGFLVMGIQLEDTQ
jgi:hypothetical protein